MEDFEEAILTRLVLLIEPKCTQLSTNPQSIITHNENGPWLTHPLIAPLGHKRAKRPQSMVTLIHHWEKPKLA